MISLRSARFVLAWALAALALPAAAESPQWRKVEGSLRQVTELAAIEQLARDYPYSSAVHLALLNAYLGADMKDAARGEIEFLASRGYAFSEAGQSGLLELYDGEAREKLRELFAIDRGPIEASEVRAVVPAEAKLVESALFDADSGLLFASTIVSQAIFVGHPDGHWSQLPLAPYGSFAGLALDAPRRTLWVGSGAYDESPTGDGSFGGLIGLDLEGSGVRLVAGPEDAVVGDIAVTADGALYASDPIRGALYSAGPGLASLSVLVPPGTFRSPQGLVPWDDGVIVSDYGYGLAFVDQAGKAWRIESDVPALLDGIDGMWRYGSKIVAVQNGARPARIVELTMSLDGRRVTGLRELERAHSGWTEPVGGAIAGDDLIYVATGQWASYGPGGVLRDGAVSRPTELRRLPLGETPAPPP